MFPRRFFCGTYFAPRYWPQSQGIAVNIYYPDIELDSSINRSASLGSTVNRTPAFTSAIQRGPDLTSDLS